MRSGLPMRFRMWYLESMRDFADFASAVSSQTVALMSGIVSFIAGLWFRFGPRRRDIPNTVFLAVAGGCVFFACYSAWSNEHLLRLSEEKHMSEISTPKLSGSIDQKVYGYDETHKAVSAMLVVGIKNLGAPSIAQGFKLRITMNGRPSKEYPPTLITDGFRVSMINKGRKTTSIFDHKMALEERTATPLSNGMLVRGWLRYEIRDIAPEVLADRSTKWEVVFLDILDHMCIASDTTSRSSGVLAYPGIEQPFSSTVKK